MSYDIATPYTASYIIFRKDGKVALLLRQNTDWMAGYYCLPAGKVEKNESYLAGAVRESKEEVGVTVDPNDLRHALTAHRLTPENLWVDVLFEAQKYEGELHNAEPHVHAELAWFDPAALPENTIPAHRYYIEQVEAGNEYCEYGWDSPAA